MAKMVGLSRTIKLPWLNKAADLYGSEYTEAEVKEQLNEFLSYEIGSPTVLRKTREILMNIWFYGNDDTKKLKDTGYSLIQKDEDNALPVHWCLMLNAYPVFVDLCRLIGKMTEFEETITVKQVRQKLYDEWGERATLLHSLDKQIATLKALGALENQKTGVYVVKKHGVRKSEVVNYMLQTMMKVDGRNYYTFEEMESSVYLFPFTYSVNKETILTDERFSLNTFGGSRTVSLNE